MGGCTDKLSLHTRETSDALATAFITVEAELETCPVYMTVVKYAQVSWALVTEGTVEFTFCI